MGRGVQATLAAAASAGAIYFIDENYCYCVGRRTFRAAECGAFIWWQYKRVWNADNASEVHRRVAEEIVATCKRNEGLYVKIGQVLCSMEVALPREMHKPFEELHDKALEMEQSEVLRLLHESGVDDVIRDFELEPVASASIAQVHKARLKASPHTSVAVKLRKPSVTFQVAWDLRAYWIILWALEKSFDIPMLWTYDFTRDQFRQEMDLRNEAANSDRAKADFENSELSEVVYVPEVFWASEDVIVAEWIDEAVKVTDAAVLGVDLGKTVRNCTEMFAHQIFNSGHVHCDPHPGNLLVRRHPSRRKGLFGRYHPHQIVLIDHGLYTDFPEELWKEYTRFWCAIAHGDRQKLKSICESWGVKDFDMLASVMMMSRLRNLEGWRDSEAAEQLRQAEWSGLSRFEKEQRIKEKWQRLVEDTKSFPRELLFVSRCVNYIRATNYRHGSPVDRVAVMMEYALRNDEERRYWKAPWYYVVMYAGRWAFGWLL